jgi:hypothetical protein
VIKSVSGGEYINSHTNFSVGASQEDRHELISLSLSLSLARQAEAEPAVHQLCSAGNNYRKNTPQKEQETRIRERSS